MKWKGLVAALVVVFGWGLIGDAMAAGPFMITLDVDVGSGTSFNMGMGPGGMGGSVMTGGGPVMFDGQQFGLMMHSTMTSTMAGMMGGQTLQHRMMSFELPGIGTVFGMMAGGSPWTGGKGIIMGGTEGPQGISGTFTVGDQVGPTRYPFTFTYSFP
ncbi:MAG TPA: hypothetical protein VJM10_07830 [Candidatus Methylomirabilis sp.]|nr:hypothetical protein [Candidatus Methylomirabilis sp.]